MELQWHKNPFNPMMMHLLGLSWMDFMHVASKYTNIYPLTNSFKLYSFMMQKINPKQHTQRIANWLPDISKTAKVKNTNWEKEVFDFEWFCAFNRRASLYLFIINGTVGHWVSGLLSFLLAACGNFCSVLYIKSWHIYHASDVSLGLIENVCFESKKDTG